MTVNFGVKFYLKVLASISGAVLALVLIPIAVVRGETVTAESRVVLAPFVMSDNEAALIEQAEKGDAHMKMVLGLRYAMGRGVPADDAKAQQWLRQSAEEGNAVAQVSLATMMAFESDEQDIQGASIWFRKAAEQGNTQAQAELARVLEMGLEESHHSDEAESWRKRAIKQADAVMLAWAWKIAATGSENWQVFVGASGKALPKSIAIGIASLQKDGISVDVKAVGRDVERGSVLAKTVGALLLATGNGVKKDEALAVKWFEQAAIAGHPYAQATLGELYLLGWGPLEADPAMAAKWMKSAAMQGLREAKTSYGAMLVAGKGVEKNEEEAFRWIRSAAQENEARAQLMMAMDALAKGDRENASQWFYRAAENGDDDVLSMLGVLYGWGNAAIAGESEKLTEVRRYAQRGELEAQLMLGLLYEEGWGVARDIVQAERWFSMAASQHYADVWLPLGLLYAETDRLKEARHAFDEAVKLRALSFVRDKGILQLVFTESKNLLELDENVFSGKMGTKKVPEEKKPLNYKEKEYGQTNAFLDFRQERIAKKIAFLKEMVTRGNPAAEMIVATLMDQGWSLPQDRETADKLRKQARKKICSSGGKAIPDDLNCMVLDGNRDRGDITTDVSDKEEGGFDIQKTVVVSH